MACLLIIKGVQGVADIVHCEGDVTDDQALRSIETVLKRDGIMQSGQTLTVIPLEPTPKRRNA